MSINFKRERIFVDIGILCCIFLLPTYISIIIGSLFVFKYRNYFEFPIFAFLIDAVYRPTPYAVIGLFGYALILTLAVEFFRDRVKPKGRDTL